ncbi:MAG: transcription antitermination factor NusB [Deltaproteobacteria bacterium]|nr:transcription antitermination factor NusB [Deltaproteobacteria bacterium]
MGTKRQAREIALQILYPVDMTGLAVDDALARFFDSFDAEPKARARAEQIVRRVHAERARIDEVLAQASPRWRLERMALVDRNLLRLCVHELLFDLETPARVVIDEGVEIAKRFGAEESARFVNGVLDAAARALGRLEGAAPEGGTP